MTSYRVLFWPDVVLNQEAKLLTRSQQLDMVTAMETAPAAQKPLQGALRGYFRYRCSDIRAVFRVDDSDKTVEVIVIGRRRESEVYDEAEKRLAR